MLQGLNNLPGADSPLFLAKNLALKNRCGKRVVGRALALKDKLRLEEGTRLAVRCTNTQDCIETIFACLKLGQELVLLPETLTDHELESILPNLACKIVLQQGPSNLESSIDYCFKAKKSEQILPLQLHTKVLFLTSGTEASSNLARPKVVQHRLSKLFSVARASNNITGLSVGDNWLLSLPISHVGGFSILLRCLLAGASVSLPEKVGMDRLASNLEYFSASHVSLVPVMLRKLLENQEIVNRCSRLRAALVSGAPSARKLLEEAHSAGIPLIPSYGCTEAGSTVSSCMLDQKSSDLLSLGRSVSGVELSIDPDSGEVLLRGANLFLGYLGQEEVDYSQQWFRTGDLGYLNQDGELFVTGRKNRLIISGGENINPVEIELAALELEGVDEAAVIACDSTKWGQRPVLFVGSRGDNFEALKLKIEAALVKKLSAFKCPEIIIVVEEIPKFTNAKTDYKELDRLFSAIHKSNTSC